jgi:arylsulfatase A-like enzyme
MSWRVLVTLSAAAGVALTAFEIVVVGHYQATYIADAAILWRILASTAVAIALLCLVCGLTGGRLHRLVGLSRSQAALAGALATQVPVALYLGRVDLYRDHSQYWLWCAAGIPVAFVCVSKIIGALPIRLEHVIRVFWPAVAPIAAWTLFAQSLHQGETFFYRAIWLVIPVWTLGAAALLLAVRRQPNVGHAFSVGSIAVVALAALSSSVSVDLNRPNTLLTRADQESLPVILLTVDTLRRDALSLYGADTPTPAIDALAADGVVFDRAYSTAPWTKVSFASIHSGLTPWAHGVRRVTDRVPHHASSLAPTMRDRGYNTVTIGRNPLLTAPGAARAVSETFADRLFFPRVVAPETRVQRILASLRPGLLGVEASTEQLSQYGSEWVRNHHKDPFFLWLHFYDPHNPYDLVAAFPPKFEPSPELSRLTGRILKDAPESSWQIPGFSEWNRALYQSEVQAVDRAIGKFVETLKEVGLYDRSLIIFSSDHGEEFAEHGSYGHGQSLYDELVRVPLVIKLPGSRSSLLLDQPVSTVAIAPTIFDLASIPYDRGLYSADSLSHSWRQSSTAMPSPAVFMTGTSKLEPSEAVVWQHYKFIRLENADHEELYELESDPDEHRNLAKSMPDQVAIGRALLTDHAAHEAKRADARGFVTPSREPLRPDEERILRRLGYLQ